jgi:hypothetical protein
MRKSRQFITIFCLAAVLASCKKDQIITYHAGNYIQFSKGIDDSSSFSFLALPDSGEAKYPVSVELVGMPENRDRTYKISVRTDVSTATPDNYTLPATFTFGAGKVIDTAWITLRKTPEQAQNPVKLVLQLDSTADFAVGQTDYSIAIIYISNKISKPDWWNSTVEDQYLGTYSDKKYTLLIQVTGVATVDPTNIPLLTTLTLELKNFLLLQKDTGHTVYEDDGTEMTVAFIGG